MSKKSEPRLSFDEWVKEKQGEMQQSKARAKAFKDSAGEMLWLRSKDAFSWITDIYEQFDLIYKSITMLREQQLASDKRTINLTKLLLGLKGKVKIKEIEKKAEEFGEYYKLFIRKAKELESEQKEREKWK